MSPQPMRYAFAVALATALAASAQAIGGGFTQKAEFTQKATASWLVQKRVHARTTTDTTVAGNPPAIVVAGVWLWMDFLPNAATAQTDLKHRLIVVKQVSGANAKAGAYIVIGNVLVYRADGNPLTSSQLSFVRGSLK